VTQIC
jgi:hypothetical protein